MPEISQLVEELTQLDVGFYCTHSTGSGLMTIPLTADELLQYVKDPTGFLASRYRVSKIQYLAWHESNYSVMCAGKTRVGKSCKNIVDGGHCVSPKQWVELQGNYCHVHG